MTFAPYDPASNGLAERVLQIGKNGLKKISIGSIQDRLAKVLMSYRITPQAMTGNSPAELLLGRRLRTRLDLLKPNTAEHVEGNGFKNSITTPPLRRECLMKENIFVRIYGPGAR